MSKHSHAELEAFLDEALTAERMSEIETAMRDDAPLRKRLAGINQRRNRGQHSLGEIWREHQVSCPSRRQLGSYLLGALPDDAYGYIKFHLESVQCRYCTANLQDLQEQQRKTATAQTEVRRRRYFQSSAGYLPRRESD